MKNSRIIDSIKMPPPKARQKSRSDTSDELKRNLIDSITNISDNSAFQEEIHNEELSMSKSTSSFNLDPRSQNANNIVNSPNAQLSQNEKNDFNFNLTNYNYNYTPCSDEEENTSRHNYEKLKENLNSKTSSSRGGAVRQFAKLPAPGDKNEIKIFVNNLMSYIAEHESDTSLVVLKIKLQTRYNDYKNKGLKQEYFKEHLVKMQRELISRICMLSEGEKKIENSNYSKTTGNHLHLGKKRQRNKIERNFSDSSSERSASPESVGNTSPCSNKSVNHMGNISQSR